MDEHLPIVLCQLTISYFDDFRDIDNLLKITKNKKYILDADIYAQVIIKNEYGFIVNYNKFSRLCNIFIHNSQYITDKFIKNNFTHTNALYLGYDALITNDGLKHLKKIRILHLGGDSKITNEGLIHLKNVHTLYLGYNSKITNDGLKYLTNVNTLYLGDNSKITNEGLKYLTNADTAVSKADGSIIASRGGLNTLYLGDNSMVTNEGLKYLTNVNTLYLGDNSMVTNEGLKYLKNRILANNKITYI